MKQKKAIRIIKKLIFVIYFLLIFEGVLRKWLLPEFSKAIFFLKDPIVIYIYFLAFKYKLFPKKLLFYITVSIIFIISILAFMQIIINSYPPIVAVYGFRMYFMYMPLSFIIFKIFTKEDIKKYIKFTLFISIPIAILIIFQFLSPPDAFINKNAGTEGGHVFQIIAGVVRPYGTFSFVIGQSFFVPSVLMFLLILKEFKFEKKDVIYKILPLSWISFFIMLALSGSRTTLANVLIIFLTIFIYSIFFLKRKSSTILIVSSSLLFILAFIILNIYFPNIIDIYITRQEQAVHSEGSTIIRGLTMLFEYTKFLSSGDIPSLGYGIGAGTSGGVSLLSGARSITLAEYDLSRIVFELGAISGLLFISYRYYLTIYLISNSIKTTIITGKYSPIIIMSYIFPTIMFGQLTANGTVMVYGWFFFGFALAINKNLKIRK